MRLALTGLIGLLLPLGLAAQHEHQRRGPLPLSSVEPATILRSDLGRHHYRISTASDRAQAWFDQGLRWFWAFNHDEAAAAFRQAEREDSTCAMCAWGVALALGPNINAPMPAAAVEPARAAVQRAQARRAFARPVELAMIDALALRYADGARATLDSSYAQAMEHVVHAFPDDREARVVLADAWMNLSPWNYWNADGSPRPATPAIVRALQDVLATDGDHPGACHLYLHAIEARDPSRGLPCAEQLAAAMPGAGHLVHMPAHIYIRVGRYADAINANQHALHADEALRDRDSSGRRGLYGSGYYAHNAHFLAFAATMMGSSRLALQHATRAVRAVDPSVARDHPWVEAILPLHHLTLVTFGRWKEVLQAPLPSTSRYATGMAYYARGVAFTARRRWAEAHAAHDSVRAIASALPEGDNRRALGIAVDALAGELSVGHGQLDEAIAAFRRAMVAEDALTYAEPPTWYYPVRHSLGKVLLKAGRAAEAEQVYREDLARFPDNGWSLVGLAESLLAQGKRREARETTARFARTWAQADVQLRSSRF
ncbi:MAG: hypothetical protein IPK85_09810 [Gemmatimonadetes bacterium]|nr:hypothetical protein [Gemmatimonadota bacterium]